MPDLMTLLASAPSTRTNVQIQSSSGMKKRQSNEGESSCNGTDEKRKRLDEELVSSPQDVIVAAFRANGCQGKVSQATASPLFHDPTDLEIESYRPDVLKAVRDQDIDSLRSMFSEGRTLQCCNRFGESLMHMACRRGFTDVVRFLVEEANCTLYVRDDYGRTAMHDAAWSPEPNFELMEYLLNKTPELLLMSDVRGHTPFSYVRKEHWGKWIGFLQANRDKLKFTFKEDSLQQVIG